MLLHQAAAAKGESRFGPRFQWSCWLPAGCPAERSAACHACLSFALGQRHSVDAFTACRAPCPRPHSRCHIVAAGYEQLDRPAPASSLAWNRRSSRIRGFSGSSISSTSASRSCTTVVHAALSCGRVKLQAGGGRQQQQRPAEWRPRPPSSHSIPDPLSNAGFSIGQQAKLLLLLVLLALLLPSLLLDPAPPSPCPARQPPQLTAGAGGPLPGGPARRPPLPGAAAAPRGAALLPGAPAAQQPPMGTPRPPWAHRRGRPCAGAGRMRGGVEPWRLYDVAASPPEATRATL